MNRFSSNSDLPPRKQETAELKIAVVQNFPVLAAWETNAERLFVLAEDAVGQGAEMLVCPEMCLTGYCFDSPRTLEKLTENESGKTFSEFSAFCRKNGVYAAYGYPEADGQSLYNSQNLIDPEGRLFLKYRKKNLYVDDLNWATPGNNRYRFADTPYGRVGLGICMDLNAPDYLGQLSRDGVEIVLFSASWISNGSLVLPYWERKWKDFQGIVGFANRGGSDERKGIEKNVLRQFLRFKARANPRTLSAKPGNGSGDFPLSPQTA